MAVVRPIGRICVPIINNQRLNELRIAFFGCDLSTKSGQSYMNIFLVLSLLLLSFPRLKHHVFTMRVQINAILIIVLLDALMHDDDDMMIIELLHPPLTT